MKQPIKLWPAVCIVIGSVVGSGIFVSAAPMARYQPQANWFLGIWLVAGFVTVLGALTQCELAARIPKSGGPYQYLRVAYGDLFGFLYGWANFFVIGSGAVAAIGYVCASYMSEFLAFPELMGAWKDYGVQLPVLGTIFPFANLNLKLMAAIIIVALTALNARGMHLATAFQTVSSTAKLFAIAAVIMGILLFSNSLNSVSGHMISSGTATSTPNLMSAITLAMAGAFWAYDGWGTITYMSEEVHDPGRTIPRAILIGTTLFVSMYLLINLAYTMALPMEQIGKVAGDRVAAAAMYAVFGTTGALMVAVLITLSTFDSTNATITTNAYVCHTMAKERVFWRVARKIHARHHTPHVSLWMQAAWAIVLLFTGSFDILISMYVFVNWLTYCLIGVSLFIIRRRDGGATTPAFQTPGYPWVPAAFIAFSVFYLLFTLVADITAFANGEQPFLKSVAGLTILLLGLPFYWFWKKQHLNEDEPTTLVPESIR